MANIPARTHDWPPIRAAFMERTPAPTWKELSAEFAVPLATVQQVASTEGWSIARLSRASAALERANAAEKLAEAAALQHGLASRVSDVALQTLDALGKTLSDLADKDLAPSTRAGVVQQVSFSIGNVANALKSLGVVGLPKALMDTLTDGKGKADPQTLQAALNQINVTVQLAREQKLDTVEVTMPPKKAEPRVVLNKMIREAERRSLEEMELL